MYYYHYFPLRLTQHHSLTNGLFLDHRAPVREHTARIYAHNTNKLGASSIAHLCLNRLEDRLVVSISRINHYPSFILHSTMIALSSCTTDTYLFLSAAWSTW